MTNVPVRMRVASARRMPDPRFHKSHGIEHHIMYVAARELASAIGKGPNAREQNTNKQVYKKVAQSLRDIDTVEGTFHLKNMGIVINAESIERIEDDLFEISLTQEDFHGIVNGGHTYDLIQEANAENETPGEQFVRVEIRTRVPNEWIPMMADGLNTSVQVQQYALADLSGYFDWIKEALKGEPYFDKIAWTENESADLDIRYVVRVLTAMHIGFFPNAPGKSGVSHPVEAYEKPHGALTRFVTDAKRNKGREYRRLKPVLKDALVLHDIVQSSFHQAYQRSKDGAGKAGRLKIVDYKDENAKKPFEFPFLEKTGRYRLAVPAVFPILAAFRWLLTIDKATGEYVWKDDFAAVKKRWELVGPDMARATAERSRELGYNPNALGKSRTHWQSMHQMLAFADLTEA